MHLEYTSSTLPCANYNVVAITTKINSTRLMHLFDLKKKTYKAPKAHKNMMV